MAYVSFIYMWYVVATKMYYLGVHNGKDPYYTHSSMSSEEFRSIVPHSQTPIKERKEFWKKYHRGEIKGIRYRRLSKRIILEDGTNYEKMCKREHELLINRKNRCWNKYYNESLGNPRYVDTSGKNSALYKHGICAGQNDWFNWPEENKERRRAYQRTPEYLEKNRIRQRNASPERKAQRKRYKKLYHARKKTEKEGTGTLEKFFK